MSTAATLSSFALAQLNELLDHYAAKDPPRVEAMLNLEAAVLRAKERIETNPLDGLEVPTAYPRSRKLRQAGALWIKEGSYWFLYETDLLVISAVFYDRSNLAGRFAGRRARRGLGVAT